MGTGPDPAQEGQGVGEMLDDMGGQDQVEGGRASKTASSKRPQKTVRAMMIPGIGGLVGVGLHRPHRRALTFQPGPHQAQAAADFQDPAAGERPAGSWATGGSSVFPACGVGA